MIIDVKTHGWFRLDRQFLERYRGRPAPWGFGDLSWATYKRTYSRDGEEWWSTCARVIEGMFTVQRVHHRERDLPWDEDAAQRRAVEAYDRMWRFKWTPPGRGLWIMGTRFMYERGGAALNNCGFVSTKDVASGFADPFLWMLRMSMLGVGVGFDTRGRGAATVASPERSDEAHVVGDSREGWADALERLLRAYQGQGALPARWDFSQVRPAGTPLRSFGGYASGAAPLKAMLESVESLHEEYVGKRIDSRFIVDTMNLIGRCVVAGGIRRSAQIAFGDPRDTDFLDLKMDREKVQSHRWASNNSVLAEIGMDYGAVARRAAANGEPGCLWLENARAYGRLNDPPDWADQEALGSNPCVEQTLWDHELCCLVETYPAHHDDLEDYKKTLSIAHEYAKTVTLIPTEDESTNAVMLRNRRTGCSMTGVVQAVNKFGYRRFLQWCDSCFALVQERDRELSERFCVPRSIKTTSIKPSGTVSLLAGATPGVHWDHAPCYIRRIRLQATHPLVEMCQEAGYEVEEDAYSQNTMVVSFPVRMKNMSRRKRDVSLREKVDLAAQMQRYWSDNQVSVTAEFDPEREADDLERVLAAYEDRLKAISFIPAAKHGYEQPPYEEISEETYERMAAAVKPLQGDLEHEHALEARFCEGDVCELQ